MPGVSGASKQPHEESHPGGACGITAHVRSAVGQLMAVMRARPVSVTAERAHVFLGTARSVICRTRTLLPNWAAREEVGDGRTSGSVCCPGRGPGPR